MGIINRRNAVFGWSVWQIAKRIGKRKAKDAVPGTGEHAGLNKSAIATIVAAITGVLFFWRKKSGETTTTQSVRPYSHASTGRFRPCAGRARAADAGVGKRRLLAWRTP